MAEITPERRKAALREMLSAWRGAALSDGATNRRALAAALDALIAQGWGPVAEPARQTAIVSSGAVEVCPICDIAGCIHIRQNEAAWQTVQSVWAAAWGTIREAEARGYRAGVEDAAKLIEGNHVLFGDRPELRPRTDGDRNGLEYAVAIRALTPGAS